MTIEPPEPLSYRIVFFLPPLPFTSSVYILRIHLTQCRGTTIQVKGIISSNNRVMRTTHHLLNGVTLRPLRLGKSSHPFSLIFLPFAPSPKGHQQPSQPNTLRLQYAAITQAMEGHAVRSTTNHVINRYNSLGSGYYPPPPQNYQPQQQYQNQQYQPPTGMYRPPPPPQYAGGGGGGGGYQAPTGAQPQAQYHSTAAGYRPPGEVQQSWGAPYGVAPGESYVPMREVPVGMCRPGVG
jgi:hypothetical protein